jgi:YfiH family protein
MNKSSIIKISEYNPEGMIYGFVSKSLLGSSFCYTWKRAKDPNAFNNRQLVLNALGTPEKQLSMLLQVHGTKCIKIEDVPELGQEIEADGQVTTNSNIVLAINTADCVPVLFYDSDHKIIGACHAGWRGALAGILPSTINKMLDNGAKLDSIEAIIGPCIHQQSYEVDINYYNEFIKEDLLNKKFFINSVKPNHYMFDLPGYVINKLRALGITRIYNSDLDTLTNEDKFFSYRRSTLRNQKLDGDVLSVIGLK